MLYEWHDTVSQSVRMTMQATATNLWYGGTLMALFRHAAMPPAYQAIIDHTISSTLSSSMAFNQLAQKQPAPSFGLPRTTIRGQDYAVTEEILADKTFGQLLHFKCETGGQPRNVPKVLIVAPISGHKATILRDTVRELLSDHDVYVTQWKDARDIPVSQGNFDLEKYMDYVQDFIRTIGPHTHVIGISQSTVPVLAVNALMSARQETCRPLSMTLMCGPIDPRINETEISRQSRKHNLAWFRQNMITPVASAYAGRGRAVFPGFLQAFGMMFAAPGRKPLTPGSLISKIFGGQGEKIDADAPYYLDTIQQVFLEHRLPRGVMTWRGERVDLHKIHDTGLLTIEGSEDDITAPGQTVVAHSLCTGLDASFKGHYQQNGAGHYDVFAGPHWQNKISNEFKDFTRKIAARHGIAYDPIEAESLQRHSPKTVAKSSLAA